MDHIADLEIELILNYIKYDYNNGTFWVYSGMYPDRKLSLTERGDNWSVMDSDDNGPRHFPHEIPHPVVKSMVKKFHNGELYW
jgi:hypothetical protein